MFDELKGMLIFHEGIRLRPYRCSEGKLTIGVGRNLEENGISREEAMQLLDHDIHAAMRYLSEYPWFHHLDDVRQDALIDLMFNIGPGSFRSFKKMIAALETGDFEGASFELIHSKYASQVGRRATRLASMLRTGVRPTTLE